VLLQVNGKYIVKSGTDFRSFGKIILTFDECSKFSVDVEKMDVVSAIEEDSSMKNIVCRYMGTLQTFPVLIQSLWRLFVQLVKIFFRYFQLIRLASAVTLLSLI